MAILDPRESLRLVDAEQRQLCERLPRLSAAELAQPSNLANWAVLDVAVHITRVCDSIMLACERATRGDRTPAFGPAAKPREDEIRAMDAAGWVAVQRGAYRSIVDTVTGLTDQQLDALTFPHPMGERAIRWYCTQLLSELAFHRWDIERSLGADVPLVESTASYLLPFMLDPAESLFGRNQLESGPWTFTLSGGGGAWVVTVAPDGTTIVENGAAQGAEISGPAGWLAPALWGRIRIDRPEISITGPSDTADRFAAIFGPKG